MSFLKLALLCSATFVLIFFQNCSLKREMLPIELASLGTITSAPLGAVRVGLNSDELKKENSFKDIGLRRLNRFELKNVLKDTFGVDPTNTSSQLPADIIDENINPFDNDVSQQSISASVIESYEVFASSYSSMISNSKIQSLAGCAPTQVADYLCFNQFVSRTGRLLLRRPLLSSEVTKYSVLVERAIAENNFYLATRLFLQVVLQHPEFLYRIESGTPVTGSSLRKLSEYEIASRMSFAVWASSPDDLLLKAAELGELSDTDKRLQHLNRMLTDVKAQRQILRFHELWLGYENAQLPINLKPDMLQETDKLILKINDNSLNHNLLEIFSSELTYLTPSLSGHYGYSVINGAGWVQYPSGRGGGILAHGRFAAQGAKFGDTSPTLRGYRILKRVLCQKLGSVPVGVDPDNPPQASTGQCKSSSYNMRSQTNCTSCHTQTDNIGFGLENLSATGQWRFTELNKPNCIIDGMGYLGIESFKGPEELGKNISQNPVAEQCVIRQVLRYNFGRTDSISDQALIEALHYEFLKSKKLNTLMRAIVSSPSFIYK